MCVHVFVNLLLFFDLNVVFLFMPLVIGDGAGGGQGDTGRDYGERKKRDGKRAREGAGGAPRRKPIMNF